MDKEQSLKMVHEVIEDVAPDERFRPLGLTLKGIAAALDNRDARRNLFEVIQGGRGGSSP